MPIPSPTSESTMKWFAKSMGFVDKVCCFSYSEQQVYSEADDDNAVYSSRLPSWEMRDDDIVYRSYQEESLDKCRTNKEQKNPNVFNYTYKHHLTSPSRSTASTVTTSTTTTVVTSTRNISGSESISSGSAPPEIFCRRDCESNRRQGNMLVLDANPRVAFTSPTEGYPC